MRPKSEIRGTVEQTVEDIGRATRKHLAAEEKIRIPLEGLRGEYSVTEMRAAVEAYETHLRQLLDRNLHSAANV